jgi:hypothetical protein
MTEETALELAKALRTFALVKEDLKHRDPYIEFRKMRLIGSKKYKRAWV